MEDRDSPPRGSSLQHNTSHRRIKDIPLSIEKKTCYVNKYIKIIFDFLLILHLFLLSLYVYYSTLVTSNILEQHLIVQFCINVWVSVLRVCNLLLFQHLPEQLKYSPISSPNHNESM